MEQNTAFIIKPPYSMPPTPQKPLYHYQNPQKIFDNNIIIIQTLSFKSCSLFIILSYSVTNSKKAGPKGLKKCYKLHIVTPAEITWSDKIQYVPALCYSTVYLSDHGHTAYSGQKSPYLTVVGYDDQHCKKQGAGHDLYGKH